MKNQKMLLSVVTISITLFLVECATQSTASAENQIDVSKKHFPEIKVAQIESLMNPKVKLGKHSGMFFTGFTYYADCINPEAILTNGKRFSDLYTASIKWVLGDAGYKTASDNNIKARLSIRGTILRAQFNTWYRVFVPHLVNAEASITVKWEVYDQQKRTIIYAKEISGKGETEGLDVEAVLLAFRNSLREFLASNDLVLSIEKHFHD